jgi:hypothetical protein
MITISSSYAKYLIRMRNGLMRWPETNAELATMMPSQIFSLFKGQLISFIKQQLYDNE